MTNYRRNRVPGGTFFFTVAIAERRLDLLVRHIDLLKTALYEARKRAPFVNLGLVVLPDHLHAVLAIAGRRRGLFEPMAFDQERLLSGNTNL